MAKEETRTWTSFYWQLWNFFFYIQSYHLIMVFLHDEVYSSWNPSSVWPVVLVSKYTNISLLEEYWFDGMFQSWSQPIYISPRYDSSWERKKLKTFYLFHTFLSCSLVDWLYIMLIFDFLSQPKDILKIIEKYQKSGSEIYNVFI